MLYTVGTEWNYVATILLTISSLSTTDAVVCYSCNDLPHPADCGNIVQCGEHEVCKTERVVSTEGILSYNSMCSDQQQCVSPLLPFGKRQSSQVLCSKCCNTSYCNKNVCETDPKVELGPRCLDCKDVLNPSDCKHVKICSQDSQCFTQAFRFNDDVRYRLGCVPKSYCESNTTTLPTPTTTISPPIVGKRQSFTDYFGTPCAMGCTTENCNRELCTNVNATGCKLSQVPVLDNCEDIDQIACIFVLRLAGEKGENGCDNLDIRNYFCRKSCGICTNPIITQEPPVPSVITTPFVTNAPFNTTSAPATTPSTNTVDPFRPPGATKNPCGDYFPDFSCHKVDCELKICSDPELRKLCPNYCNGRCRPKDCSDIPGFVSDQ